MHLRVLELPKKHKYIATEQVQKGEKEKGKTGAPGALRGKRSETSLGFMGWRVSPLVKVQSHFWFAQAGATTHPYPRCSFSSLNPLNFIGSSPNT